MTRILHITTVPMSLTFLRGQVGYMLARGLDVHALSSPGEALRAFGDDEGIPVHVVEMRRSVTPLRDLRAVAAIHRHIRSIRPDLVHAHTPKGGLLAMVAAALARVPVRVYHMRGLRMMGANGQRRELLRRCEQLSCVLAHRVLCVSRSLREIAIAEGICAPAKIRVLRNGSGQGVDAIGRFNPARLGPSARLTARQRFGIGENARVVGFVGRIVRDKGVIELAEAWQILREALPDLHLLMVGPLEPQDGVPRDIVRMLEEDPRVHLAGMDWDTPPLYAAMDVVALPSYREGFPNVPLEAASMELPVVTTRTPGCIDAIRDNDTGILVPVRDAAALAKALRLYLEDPGLRARHGRTARTRALEKFRREDIWEAIHDEYSSLLAEYGVIWHRSHSSVAKLRRAESSASAQH